MRTRAKHAGCSDVVATRDSNTIILVIHSAVLDSDIAAGLDAESIGVVRSVLAAAEGVGGIASSVVHEDVADREV